MPRRSIPLTSGSVEADVAGDGPVTVLFENGLGSPLEVWDGVVPAIARRARTLRYDHRTAPPTGRLSARSVADVLADLDNLLGALHLPPPYVLVGHSWGGVIARLFASAHPSDVAGLVLVDATHEAVDSGILAAAPQIQSVMGLLCRVPFIRRRLIRQLCPPGSSPDYRARIEHRLEDPKQGLRSSRTELAAIRPALAKLKLDCPDLPHISAHVLTAGGEKSKMARTNRAAWQTTAERAGAPYTEIPTIGHLMPIEAPDAVVNAIVNVLDAIESGRTLGG